MKFIDFLLSLGALASLLVATYLFSTDESLGKTVDELSRDQIELINEKTGLFDPSERVSDTSPLSEEQTRWKYIVIHHSSTKRGNARMFDRYHRKEKGYKDGLSYHFVIGNGTNAENGELEVGKRWFKEISGPHCFDAEMNERSIGICLVGDFEKDKPTRRQIKTLVYLIKKLRKEYKIPTRNIIGHNDVDKNRTDCPGKNFSLDEIRTLLK